jgi:hypothetical protein
LARIQALHARGPSSLKFKHNAPAVRHNHRFSPGKHALAALLDAGQPLRVAILSSATRLVALPFGPRLLHNDMP